MKKLNLLIIVAFWVFLSCGYANASVLYWCDWNQGSNPFPQALTELGETYVTASSASDFNTQLGSASWDGAILLLQNWRYSPSDFSNVPTYLGSGGKVIFTDWTMDATMGSWFGVTYTGGINNSPVTFDADFLKTGIGDTIALSNPNPGWGTWSMDIALNGASKGAHFDNNSVAIAYSNNYIINGMLKDTFSNYSQGLQLAKNEINYLRGTIPEPATFSLLGIGILGLVRKLRRSS